MLKSHISYEKFIYLIITIQKYIRRHLAKKIFRKLNEQINNSINILSQKSMIIQKKYKIYINKKHFHIALKKLKNIIKIQSIWRSYKCRKELEYKKEEKDRLLEIGHDYVILRSLNRSAIKIQRVFRGYSDRLFAKLKRKYYIRSTYIIRKAWRTYKLAKFINKHFDYDHANIYFRVFILTKYMYYWNKF